jgi:hypothetical protein
MTLQFSWESTVVLAKKTAAAIKTTLQKFSCSALALAAS